MCHADRDHRNPPGTSRPEVRNCGCEGRPEIRRLAEQLANFQVGAKYDIDVSERTFKGRTYQSITKATPANGAAKPTTNGSATGTTAHTDSEPQFVATVLAALVMKAEVVNNKRQLFEATNMLRGLWGATFGGQHSNGGPA